MMKTVRLLWIVAFQWQHLLETSRKFSDLFISFYPRAYTIWSSECGKAETQRFALSVEYIQVVGISQFVKKKPEISAPRPPMDFTRFFSWMKNTSQAGSETRRTMELPSCTARQGVELEPIESYLVSRENFPRSFRISVVFF